MAKRLPYRATIQTRHRVTLTAVLVVTFMLGIAPFDAEARGPGGADIWYDSSPATVLVSYHEIQPELADPDPTPRLRIFGDGRVLVHYSAMLRRAGDYELHLTPTELADLIHSLADDGLVDFDPKAVAIEKEDVDAERAEAELASGEPPTLFEVADAQVTVLEFRVSGYRAQGAALSAGEIHRKIRWRGLRGDAQRYPKIKRIQRLRTVQQRLRSLLARDDLRRLQ